MVSKITIFFDWTATSGEVYDKSPIGWKLVENLWGIIRVTRLIWQSFVSFETIVNKIVENTKPKSFLVFYGPSVQLKERSRDYRKGLLPDYILLSLLLNSILLFHSQFIRVLITFWRHLSPFIIPRKGLDIRLGHRRAGHSGRHPSSQSPLTRLYPCIYSYSNLLIAWLMAEVCLCWLQYRAQCAFNRNQDKQNANNLN